MFTKTHLNGKSKEKQVFYEGIYMAKGEYEKSIRISPKPAKKSGPEVSFVQGARQSKVAKPKSLTPKAPMKKK